MRWRGLETRFLVSKSAEPGNEVTGRFGGPERYQKARRTEFVGLDLIRIGVNGAGLTLGDVLLYRRVSSLS